LKVVSLEDRGFGSEELFELRRLLNAWLPKDFVDDEMVRHVTVDDPNFDPRLVLYAVDGGEVRGVLLGAVRTRAPPEALERDRGVAWVKVVAGSRDAMALLLREFEGLARSMGCRELRYGGFTSWYLFPGVDSEYVDTIAVLEGLGWRRVGRVVDYLVDMSRFYVPRSVRELEARLRERGVVVERGRRSEASDVAKWVLERFGPAWKTEALMAFSRPRPTIFVARRGSEVLGFSCYSALHTTWFGPIGVDERARGMGIGTALQELGGDEVGGRAHS